MLDRSVPARASASQHAHAPPQSSAWAQHRYTLMSFVNSRIIPQGLCKQTKAITCACMASNYDSHRMPVTCIRGSANYQAADLFTYLKYSAKPGRPTLSRSKKANMEW